MIVPRTRSDLASKAWNVMGGELDWSALEFVVGMLGVEDVEPFVAELVAIREFNRRSNDGSPSGFG